MPRSSPKRAAERPLLHIVGLGPAGAKYRAKAASRALRSGPPVLLRTARHPATAALLRKGATSLDHCYEQADTFAGAYEAIVAEVSSAAHHLGEVIYAVPGSPLVLESTVQSLCANESLDIDIVPSMSFLELCWWRLGLDPVSAGVRLVDGEALATADGGLSGPSLVAQVWSKALLSELKLHYDQGPEEAVILHHLGLGDEKVLTLDFSELDRHLEPDHLTCVYLPEAGESLGTRVNRLIDVVRILRERCPWDAVQTHQSLVRHLLEETYEAIEAIDELGEPPTLSASAHLEEELGDVLCQVLFHAAIAQEEGLFGFAEVAQGLLDKLIARHPHVFSTGGPLLDAEQVLAQWEQAKQREKGRTSVMEGVPNVFPALSFAQKIERRALGVGALQATELHQVLAEAGAKFSAGDYSVTGQLLLAIAALSGAAGVDAEDELRREARQVRDLVVRAEQAALAEGVTLSQASEGSRARYFAAAAGAFVTFTLATAATLLALGA